MPCRNRAKAKFPGFYGNIPQEQFKLFNTKIAFHFTAGRLSENLKIRPTWNYDFGLQPRCNSNTLAADIGPYNLKLALEQCFEL